MFVGGQSGYPRGLLYSIKHNFAPRLGIAKRIPRLGLVFHSAYGIFFTPVDGNTWCNQRHNVPYVFPETQQADNFTPPASLFAKGLNFGTPVLGQGTLPATTVSFTAFDPHAAAQYIQQLNTSVEKSLGRNTSVQVGYVGARGFHLQRAHLINNARLDRARSIRAARSRRLALFQAARSPRRMVPPASYIRATLFRSAQSICWKTRRKTGTTPAMSTRDAAIRTV